MIAFTPGAPAVEVSPTNEGRRRIGSMNRHSLSHHKLEAAKLQRLALLIRGAQSANSRVRFCRKPSFAAAVANGG